MYSSSAKQFIFRQSTGKVWNIYHDQREGLCYCLLRSNNTWSNPTVLEKHAIPFFHAEMDEDDRFHILFQDGEGNISYMLIENDTPQTYPVLRSKTPTSYDKCLGLLPLGNSVHFFYIVHHNEKTLLAHQIMTGGEISNPKVIDYVARGDTPYSVVRDKSDSIYCFYQAANGQLLTIGYKKYNSSQKTWGELIQAAEGTGECELPKVLSDNRNIIHLLFQRSTAERYDLVYRQKVPDKNIWSPEAVIHSSSKPFPDASIAMLNGSLTIYWVRSDTIFYSSSSDDGAVWSRPSRYNFYSGRQLFCMAYRSNHQDEANKIAVKELPGSFINGLRLGFYQLPAESTSQTSPEDFRVMLVDSLKTLKGSIEELQEADSKTNDTVTNLERLLDQIRRDMDKFSIRLELAETRSNPSKAPIVRNDFVNEINELRASLKQLSLRIDKIEKFLKE